jgi:hypothetical protein
MNNPFNRFKKDEIVSTDFDLFAAPVDDHLAEQLAKGSFEWTNKWTRVLMAAVLVVGCLSLGAWYGHRSATSSSGVSANGFASLRSGFAGRGGFGTGAGAAAALPGGGGGGGFNRGTPAQISKVTGNKVEITLSGSSTLKVGDSITVRAVTGGFGGAAGSAPSIPTTTNKGSSKSKTTTTTKPSIGGSAPAVGGAPGGGQGRGGFNNPELTACLKKEGVVTAEGARPDRTDAKVAAALQKCFAAVGGGFGGAPGGAPGGMPGAAPDAAPSN